MKSDIEIAIQAIKKGNLARLKQVIEANQQIVNTLQPNNSYLLHFAAFKKFQDESLNIFLYLLKKGGKQQLLCRDNKGRTVLEYALLGEDKFSYPILNFLLFKVQVPISDDIVTMLQQKRSKIESSFTAEQANCFSVKLDKLLNYTTQISEWSNERSRFFNLNEDLVYCPSLKHSILFAVKKSPSIIDSSRLNSLPPEINKQFNDLPDTLEEYYKENGLVYSS